MDTNPGNKNTSLKICQRCIYDERIESISFDNEGVCNICRQIEELKSTYGTGEQKGELIFKSILEEIKQDGKGKKYDCIVGLSGGTDSSYLLYLAKKWGLRPLAVHYDNTWNSSISTMNIEKILTALDVDLYTKVINNVEADDIFKSFFMAGVAELEASTDLGYACLLREVAAKFSIKYILEGHSFIEEGITPLGKNYFDGKYIKSIHNKYGHSKMKTYPLLSFRKFLKFTLIDRVKFIRPYWYIDYSKSDAIEFLQEKFNWEYYGGHHLENRMSAFLHSVYLPNKFNMDMRNNTLSANVRKGLITRSEALKIYNEKPEQDERLIAYFRKRLDIDEKEYYKLMNEKPNYWYDFPTYKRRFEFLAPLFYILAKSNLVPMSFYLKYCTKGNQKYN